MTKEQLSKAERKLIDTYVNSLFDYDRRQNPETAFRLDREENNRAKYSLRSKVNKLTLNCELTTTAGFVSHCNPNIKGIIGLNIPELYEFCEEKDISINFLDYYIGYGRIK